MSDLTTLREGVRSLPISERKALVIETANNLDEQGKQEVVSSLGPPTQRVADIIWVVIVAAFALVLIGSFGTMAWVSVSGKEQPVLLTVFSSVAALLAGLLAPSPIAKRG
ncbi:MAG: hypothetical protein IPK82_19810 [Polyangiaceae bacterium]|nr:hypothetical protein [Polyangiaceae bacterium]